MNTYVQIIGDSRTRIWGMTGRERLVRMLDKIAGVEIISEQADLPSGAPVIFFRGDYIYDTRVLQAVIGMDGEFVLYRQDGATAVALRANTYDANIFDLDHYPEALAKVALNDLVNPYDSRLMKYEPARVRQIRSDNRDSLEQELFSNSYKGVTDLVTKWAWPRPAKWATKICARLGIRPNYITGLSMVLALLAGVAFWYGEFASGLVLGWFMTFLDTVDGKLARVTLASSRFGDLLDHGLDLIHPPLWYIAWGVGLTVQSLPVALAPLACVMLAGYIGGRLCEGVFQKWIAPFSIFLWQPVDSLSRLITARRNPNLLILTFSLLAGRPDTGLVIVIVWHVLSTLFLLARLAMALKAKQDQGMLVCWLAAIDSRTRHNKLALKIFT